MARVFVEMLPVDPMGDLTTPTQGPPPRAPLGPTALYHEIQPFLFRLVGRDRGGMQTIRRPQLVHLAELEIATELAPLEVIQHVLAALIEVTVLLVNFAVPKGSGLRDGVITPLPDRQVIEMAGELGGMLDAHVRRFPR